jgi:hypothetical protein
MFSSVTHLCRSKDASSQKPNAAAQNVSKVNEKGSLNNLYDTSDKDGMETSVSLVPSKRRLPIDFPAFNTIMNCAPR